MAAGPAAEPVAHGLAQGRDGLVGEPVLDVAGQPGRRIAIARVSASALQANCLEGAGNAGINLPGRAIAPAQTLGKTSSVRRRRRPVPCR